MAGNPCSARTMAERAVSGFSGLERGPCCAVLLAQAGAPLLGDSRARRTVSRRAQGPLGTISQLAGSKWLSVKQTDRARPGPGQPGLGEATLLRSHGASEPEAERKRVPALGAFGRAARAGGRATWDLASTRRVCAAATQPLPGLSSNGDSRRQRQLAWSLGKTCVLMFAHVAQFRWRAVSLKENWRGSLTATSAREAACACEPGPGTRQASACPPLRTNWLPQQVVLERREGSATASAAPALPMGGEQFPFEDSRWGSGPGRAPHRSADGWSGQAASIPTVGGRGSLTVSVLVAGGCWARNSRPGRNPRAVVPAQGSL